MTTQRDIADYLDKNLHRHLSNKVLHAHPSPSFWSPPDALKWDTEQMKKIPAGGINLYLSIPFCLPTDPPHCGFCLFPTEDYSGKEATQSYLNHLRQEALLYQDISPDAYAESIYIGGGTPNLLQTEDYRQMLEISRLLIPNQAADIEKTVEGIPQLFTAEKVRAIKEAGFNRISMGVQQLNERLIKYSGRKQTNKQVFEAIGHFKEHGLAFNVDLIYGWPGQTLNDVLSDLRQVVEQGAEHITHYELNIAARSHFSVKGRDQVPDIPEKLNMYLAAREYLLASGYRQRTVYDWEKCDDHPPGESGPASSYRYEDNLRKAAAISGPDQAQRFMLGLGHSAISIRPQKRHAVSELASSMNHRSLERYIQDIQHGRLPIERVFCHDAEDMRLLWIFQSLQELKIETDSYQTLFGEDFFKDHGPTVQALAERGWFSMKGSSLELSPVGSFYVPLIQSAFAHPRNQTLRRAMRLTSIPVVRQDAAAQACRPH